MLNFKTYHKPNISGSYAISLIIQWIEFFNENSFLFKSFNFLFQRAKSVWTIKSAYTLKLISLMDYIDIRHIKWSVIWNILKNCRQIELMKGAEKPICARNVSAMLITHIFKWLQNWKRAQKAFFFCKHIYLDFFANESKNAW